MDYGHGWNDWAVILELFFEINFQNERRRFAIEGPFDLMELELSGTAKGFVGRIVNPP